MGKYGAILIIASIILALVAWWRSAARNSPAMRVLGLLMGMAFLVEVTGFITRSGNYNNSPMYNSFVCTEFVLVLGLARLTVPKWRAHLSLAGLVGMLVLWGDLALRNTARVLLQEGVLVTSLMLAVVCLAVLWHLANTMDGPIWRRPAFWLFTVTLVYHVGLLPMIGLMDVLASRYHLLFMNLYVMVQVVAVVRYLCMARCCQLATPAPGTHG